MSLLASEAWLGLSCLAAHEVSRDRTGHTPHLPQGQAASAPGLHSHSPGPEQPCSRPSLGACRCDVPVAPRYGGEVVAAKAAVDPRPSPGLRGRPPLSGSLLPPKAWPRTRGIFFTRLVAATLGSEQGRQSERVPWRSACSCGDREETGPERDSSSPEFTQRFLGRGVAETLEPLPPSKSQFLLLPRQDGNSLRGRLWLLIRLGNHRTVWRRKQEGNGQVLQKFNTE